MIDMTIVNDCKKNVLSYGGVQSVAMCVQHMDDDRLWLHRDRVPLAEVDIDTPDKGENRQCGLGMCFV